MTDHYKHWNDWQLPSDEQLKAFVHLVTPHIKWLEPAIVAGIADFNELHQIEWTDLLKEVGVPAAPYLWERSPCTFPGVRRHSKGDKPASFLEAKTLPAESKRLKKEAKALNPKADWQPTSFQHLPAIFNQDDCLVTDDNDYPYQLWRYVVKGSKSGADPRKVGFHLAHLFPHNDYTLKQLRKAANQSHDHWLEGWPETLAKYSFSGLYTSAANMCCIPAELMRPTDLNGPLRRLMLQKAHDLYGKECNMFPQGLRELLSQENTTQWHHTEFEWDETHNGDVSRLAAFNQYRATEFANLVSKKRLVPEDKKSEK